MAALKYTIIKNRKQYDRYCKILEEILIHDLPEMQDEIDLLTLLIEKWDNEHKTIHDTNPVELLKSLMEEHHLKAKELAEILELSKGTVSKILSYHKGLSKDTIRKLSSYFKLSQEAFNRPYKLINQVNKFYRDASLMNTEKNMVADGDITNR
jgi:HTH-type transcriptional regulator/antitoxin HigA